MVFKLIMHVLIKKCKMIMHTCVNEIPNLIIDTKKKLITYEYL